MAPQIRDAPLRLAIVRSPSHLNQVESRRSAAFVPPGTPDASALASLFRTDTRPLTGPGVPTSLAALAAAWRRLAASRANSPETLADVLLVLLSTVPSAERHAMPTPRLDAPSRPPRSTAAHPRAFRGTKYKPPRAGEPTQSDLRPLLCAPASTRALLAALWPFKTAALRSLRQLGLDERGLARIAAQPEAPADPYLVFHHSDAPDRASLPPRFVERLLPSMAGSSWERVRRAAAVHKRLELDDDEALAVLAARALQLSRANALAWLHVVATQPPSRRHPFLALALETGAIGSEPRLPETLGEDLADAPDEMYERWVYVALDARQRGVDPRYLAAGLHYAVRYAPDTRFWTVRHASGFDEGTARRLERLLPVDWAGHDLLDLWDTCGALPGFSSYVRDCDWTRFTPEQRKYVLRFFRAMKWHADGPFDPVRWTAIALHIPRLEACVRQIPPEYTDQYLNDLDAVLSDMRTPTAVRERFPLAIDLLARVNHPPFHTDGNAGGALGHLLKLPKAVRGRALLLEDPPFLALDKACRRSNAATLITWGLSSLVDGMPDLVGEAFGSATGALIRTARHLGVLSWPVRARLVRRCTGLPIFAPDLAKRPLAEIVPTILDTGVPDAAAAVPRAVRDHLLGRRTLSPTQIERHLGGIRRSLPACRLAVVRAAVDAQLARAIGSDQADREALSALALLQDTWKNKRSLRRFLRAFLNGDRGYLRHHPATQRWASRHAKIDLELWTGGLERTVRGRDGREVSLRIEQDPLEVLKMGTYVGSCLGIGGGHSYSAAAALLDVNKQVLYARDPQGSVIARQLVAISDDDRLVPFAVYPESTPQWLRDAFDRYDTALAAALGIPRAAPAEPYFIDHVLSQEWWDDGAWHPEQGARVSSRAASSQAATRPR